MNWERFNHPSHEEKWTELAFVDGQQVGGIVDRNKDRGYRAYADCATVKISRDKIDIGMMSQDFVDLTEARIWVEANARPYKVE